MRSITRTTNELAYPGEELGLAVAGVEHRCERHEHKRRNAT